MKRTLMTGPAAAARFVPLYIASVTVDRAAAVAAHALAACGRASRRGPSRHGGGWPYLFHVPAKPDAEDPAHPYPFADGSGRAARPRRPGPSLERLSINLPYLMQARRVVLALTGKQKRAVFEREAAGDPAVQPIAALLAANVPLDVLWTETA
jgi:6-phosphogluconolactonase